MPEVKCPGCNYPIEVSCQRRGRYAGIRLLGVLTCLRCDDRSWPVELEDGELQPSAPTLTGSGSATLSANVPLGLVGDTKEAERAYFAHCYKASVVMCRRVIQLALESKGAKGHTLGPLLQDSRAKSPPLLNKRTDTLAEGIKDFGDGGAHRTEIIQPNDVAIVLHVTTQVLNELFSLETIPLDRDLIPER